MFSNFFFRQMKISICQNQPQKDLFVAKHTHAQRFKITHVWSFLCKIKKYSFLWSAATRDTPQNLEVPNRIKGQIRVQRPNNCAEECWVQVRFFPIQLNAKTAKRKHKTFIVSRKNTEWSNKFQPIVSVGFYFCGRGEYFYNSQTHTHTNISTHGYEKSLTRPSKSIGE